MAGLYNEPYVKFLHDKHPRALGEPYVLTWSELYSMPDVADQLDHLWSRGIIEGKATPLEHQPFYLRNGNRLEEQIFNVNMLPIIDEHGSTVGFYEPLTEITNDYLNDRRSNNVRKIGELTAGEENPSAFYQSVIKALEPNENDFPFALLYSLQTHAAENPSTHSITDAVISESAVLESFLGVLLDSNGRPVVHEAFMNDPDFISTFAQVCASGQPALFDLESRPALKVLAMEDPPTRGFGDEPRVAVLAPIEPTTRQGVNAVLVMGINPRRPYDAEYESFVRGLARSVSSALASVQLVIEQKSLVGKAREMEQRALSMIEVSPVGSFLMKMDGEILYVNQTWLDITEYKYDKFWPMSWLELFADDYSDILAEEWARLVDHHMSVNTELALKSSWTSTDPSTGDPISSRKYVIAAASVQQIGESMYITGALIDISKQKWMESWQALRRQEAVELKRQQENFMDMTSHEMRNPLSAIFQCADAIAASLASFQEARSAVETTSPRRPGAATRTSVFGSEDPITFAIEAAGTITLCAQHQKRIVDDVLVLSKVDANLIEIHPVDCQPGILIENSLKMFSAELVANNAIMSFNIEDSIYQLGIDWVKLDPGRLLQVIINLCTNAIKFTMDSEIRRIAVTMGASTSCPSESSDNVQYLHQPMTDQDFADPTLRAEWGQGQHLYLHFQVKDTGRGMSQEEMKVLFKRFSQASPRTHTQYGGSGLGLFIARLLSRLQGGEIGVKSATNQGSIFAFYIKIRRAATPHGDDIHTVVPEHNLSVGTADPASPSLHQARPRPCSDFTILVVEDNLVNQKVLSKQLRMLGFTVEIANNGQESIDFLRRTDLWNNINKQIHQDNAPLPLTLILMDIEMPIMSGTEATHEIRSLTANGQIRAHVPIIAITANARSEQIAQAKESGMDDVVSKPFRIAELIGKIEGFVGALEMPGKKSSGKRKSSVVH
ncbi:putative hsp90-like protein [Venturia nashicola]|nr:putative hsp90-like protein [Venturia nashicola]